MTDFDVTYSQLAIGSMMLCQKTLIDAYDEYKKFNIVEFTIFFHFLAFAVR